MVMTTGEKEPSKTNPNKTKQNQTKPLTQHENLHHFCNSRDYNMILDIRPFPKASTYKRYQKDKGVFKFMLPFIFMQI